MNDEDAKAGATLSSRTKSTPIGAFHGVVDVGRRHDDQRVLSAQFKRTGDEITSAHFADHLANTGRTREGDFVDQTLVNGVNEVLSSTAAFAVNEVDDTVGQTCFVHDAGQRKREERGVLRTLPNAGVAAHDGRNHLPKWNS